MIVVLRLDYLAVTGPLVRQTERYNTLAGVPTVWARHITSQQSAQVIYAEGVAIIYTPRTHEVLY
ncbi:hypothetical protein THIX_61005 [Thiomonas sp. X19]|uniref:hypothetical protein n=1 Tax=Thiomonas sp. X19 TaxID=1050370 RepID=UPI000B68FD63|nr:hypothetical protein [Thiomonas sp. X19]SCC94947.1 hypothetical protein THIX_61005 [Thiomonas sp. X19]